MNMFVDNSQSVMDSTSKEEWHKLQESTKLLTELLVYATSDRKQYSSASNGGINDPNEMDVQSLRERLEKFDLDVDGSRTMIVARWKKYLQTNTQSTTTGATGAASVTTTTIYTTRDRLQKFNLDVDGSRTMIVERWKNYSQTNTQSTTTGATGTADTTTATIT